MATCATTSHTRRLLRETYIGYHSVANCGVKVGLTDWGITPQKCIYIVFPAVQVGYIVLMFFYGTCESHKPILPAHRPKTEFWKMYSVSRSPSRRPAVINSHPQLSLLSTVSSLVTHIDSRPQTTRNTLCPACRASLSNV